MQPQQTPVTSSSKTTTVSLHKGKRAQRKEVTGDLTVTPANNLHENPTSFHVIWVTQLKHVNTKNTFFFIRLHKSFISTLLYPVFQGTRCQTTAAWHVPCSATSIPQVLAATVLFPGKRLQIFSLQLCPEHQLPGY